MLVSSRDKARESFQDHLQFLQVSCKDKVPPLIRIDIDVYIHAFTCKANKCPKA